MTLAYQQPGLSISRTEPASIAIIKSLQRDLRALGYLRSGIDGNFGAGTERAVRALQYDLIHNTGDSRADDGRAPVAIADYSVMGGVRQVTTVNGVVDQALVACIAALLADVRVPQLPSTQTASADNAKIAAALGAIRSGIAPSPFVVAILQQESGCRHYCVPSAGDEDDFIVTGLDHQAGSDDDHITSRGYGVGQYTLFHHPPRVEEVADVMSDPARNVSRTFAEFREKFDRFVAGPSDQCDDRAAEHPLLPLRICKYAPSDARYLADCKTCAMQVRKVDIFPGTPVYRGASTTYRADQYYASAAYRGVPERADFPCDWPYAVRRYNGAGLDSYHYQTRVLLNLLTL